MRRCQVRSGATRASLRRTAPSARECGNPSAQCRAEEVHRPSFVGLALVTGATVCVRAAGVAGVRDHDTLRLPGQAVVAGAHHEPRRTFAPRSNQARRWSRPRLLRRTMTSSPRPRPAGCRPGGNAPPGAARPGRLLRGKTIPPEPREPELWIALPATARTRATAPA